MFVATRVVLLQGFLCHKCHFFAAPVALLVKIAGQKDRRKVATRLTLQHAHGLKGHGESGRGRGAKSRASPRHVRDKEHLRATAAQAHARRDSITASFKRA